MKSAPHRACHLIRSAVALLLLALFFTAQAQAQIRKDPSPYSDAALIAEHTSIRPGTPFTVALRLQMDPHWHSYWSNPGDSGLPTTIAWKLPAGFKAGPIQWPYPQRIDMAPLVSYAYENEVWLLTTITPPASLPAGKSITLKALAKWLVCKEECVPAQADLTLSLPVSDAETVAASQWNSAFAKTRAALPSLPAGWAVAAERGTKSIVLRVQPPAGTNIVTEGAQFFAGENSVINYAAPQKITKNGSEFRLALSLSEYATAAPKRLRGILIAPKGRTSDVTGVRALAIDVPIGAPSSAPLAAGTTASSAPSGSAPPTFLLSLGLALLGGLMLNLMPCVFPVLSLKILGFVQQSGDDKGRIRKHGFAFGIGVLVSFWVLACALLVVRAGGGGAGWGFQLQSPLFVAALALLLFGVGLNLLGAFNVGLSLTGLGAKSAVGGHSGYGSSFWSGVLATVVATPCTAPFMGAALGFALSQPPLPALLVFTFLGIGMATPYVLLSMNPAWLRKLPRPGAWMETFKQFMAFPIFATVLWLAWVFGLQTGVDGVTQLLGSMLLLGAAIWFWSRWNTTEIVRPRRALVSATSLLLLTLALVTAWKGAANSAPVSEGNSAGASASAWQPFSMAKVEELSAAGKPVFVDFTAAWCITCQVNKRVTLAQPKVMEAFEQRGVTLMRADWTRRDAEITRALESHGRSGVPTYVLYAGKDAKPKILPEVLSETIVLNALEEIPERLAAQPEPR
jgi:thiol:disulfide interchange protein DsbD